MSDTPTLHMLCGKIAAGKSTLARQLAEADQTILIAEDDWLRALFADQMATPKDFLRCSDALKSAMGPHIASLLKTGLSVVLDFQANTVDARAWMRSILEATGAAHKLHVLDPPDEVCLARLRARNAEGEHPFSVTEEQFRIVSKHFAPPTAEEGFNLVHHRQAY